MNSELLRQDDFTGGEVAKVNFGRTKSAAYLHGLRLALNFFPTLEGQLLNRSGTRFIVAVKDPSYAPSILEFAFSDQQTLLLEIGDKYIRFVQNGAQVQNGGVPYEVASPWAIADVPFLKWGQNGDVITFDCVNPMTGTQYAPQDLTRVSNTNWTIAAASYVPQGFFGQSVVYQNFTLGAFGLINGSVSGQLIPQNLYSVPKAGQVNLQTPTLYDPAHTYDITNPGTNQVCYFQAADGFFRRYVSLQAANTGNQPDISPAWWRLQSWDDFGQPVTGAANNVTRSGVTWAKGDFCFYQGILFVSLADNNFDQTPNPAAATAYWARADDSTHPATASVWAVTQLWQDSFGRRLETLASASYLSPYGGKFPRYPDRPLTLQWGAPGGGGTPANYVLLGHRIYCGAGSTATGASRTLGLIGATDANTFSFQDIGQTIDYGTQPPRGTNPFDIATGANTKTQSYPLAVTYHEQRILHARSQKKPQDVWGSAIGDYHRFDINTPVQDSDSFDFRPASEQLEEARWLLSLRHLLIGTGESVFNASGASGAIGPNSITMRRATKNGVAFLRPLPVDQSGLFLSSRGRVRDLVWDWRIDNYQSRDVSVIARHLFDSRTIVDWDYAQHPWSLVYAVRDDGVLLTMTYAPGGVEAWARQTTSGRFERVAAVTETDPASGVLEDAVYVVVRRVISGTVKRYIERFSTRLMPQTETEDGDGVLTFETDVRLCNFLDASLQYDGRQNALGFLNATLKIDSVATPGSLNPADYAAGKQVTVTAVGVTPFSNGQLNTASVVFDPDGLSGSPIQARIVGYTSTSVVTAELDSPLSQAQVNLWHAGGTPWGIASSVLTGLGHLEGKSVTVLADGAPVGPFVVQLGQITLGSKAVLAQVGLTYNSDMELLDVPVDAVKTNVKSVRKLTLEVAESRGVYAGQSFDGESLKLYTPKQQGVADGAAVPPLATGNIEVAIATSWTQSGRACVRQSDPLPLTIVAAVRELVVGGR